MTKIHAEGVGFARAAAILWAWTWRVFTLEGVGSVLVNRLMADLGAAEVVNLAVEQFIGLWMIKYVLGMQRFSVKLLPEGSPPNWTQSLSIWWCFNWRLHILLVLFMLSAFLLDATIDADGAGRLAIGVVVIAACLFLVLLAFRFSLRKRYRTFTIQLG